MGYETEQKPHHFKKKAIRISSQLSFKNLLLESIHQKRLLPQSAELYLWKICHIKIKSLKIRVLPTFWLHHCLHLNTLLSTYLLWTASWILWLELYFSAKRSGISDLLHSNSNVSHKRPFWDPTHKYIHHGL